MGLPAAFEHPRLSGRATHLFWWMVALGAVVRLVLAFTTRGQDFDITSFELVRDALQSHPLDLYGLVNVPFGPHWPYPPAFFPWVLISDWASELTGLRFDGFVQVAPIGADAAIAWIVQAHLGQRGAGDRSRLAAAGLVALGPSFATISGYHGQIDSVCILPAILGFWIWSRSDSPDRALIAGLLVGLGIAIKPPAGLVLLALVPSARSGRELVRLGFAAALVPVVMLLPFLLASFSATIHGLTVNRGLAGIGGISLLLQPNLSADWLRTSLVAFSPLSQAVNDYSTAFALLALLATTAALYRRRTQPEPAAVIVWLTFFSLGVNFSFNYLVLGLPFFLIMGRIRQTAALQAGILVPMLMFYVQRGRSLPLVPIYSSIMLVVWAGLLIWLIAEIRRIRATDGDLGAGTADIGRQRLTGD